jgi:predicted membrane metal-binding protein
MSFLLAPAIFGFIFIVQRPECHLLVSRYLLTLAGLFSYFCYTQEVERLGKSLIEGGQKSVNQVIHGRVRG